MDEAAKFSVTLFQYQNYPVRTTVFDGVVWFVAKDLCTILELSNPTMALEGLDDDEKMTLSNSEGHAGQRGGAQFYNVVNESGLYALVFKSRKPEARIFRKWVTSEVLPAIRQTGQYARQEPVPADCQLVPTAEYIGLLKEKIAWLEGRGQERVKRSPRLPLSQDEVTEIRRLKGLGYSLREVAERTGRSRAAISMVCRNLQQEVAQ